MNVFQQFAQDVEDLAIEIAKEKGIQLEVNTDSAPDNDKPKKPKRNVKPFVQTEMEI